MGWTGCIFCTRCLLTQALCLLSSWSKIDVASRQAKDPDIHRIAVAPNASTQIPSSVAAWVIVEIFHKQQLQNDAVIVCKP